MEEAHVTELTGLLREGPAGDQLAGWPASMRVFARRERPHPGAQLTLFETEDGWRYTLQVSNLPAHLRGWRSQLAYIDAAHRVHARVEDRIRTGKDCGIGHFPSQSLAINSAWLTASLIAATLLAWLAHRPGRRPGKSRAENPALPGPARRGEADPRREAPTAQDPRNLALGPRDRRRLGRITARRRPLTSSNPPQQQGRKNNRGAWNPRPPGPPAGPPSYPDPKITIRSRFSRPPSAGHQPA